MPARLFELPRDAARYDMPARARATTMSALNIIR